MKISQDSGALTNAGLAALTLIEGHGATKRLHSDEVYEVYLRADGLLKDTQDSEDIARLRACARIVMRRLSGSRIHEKNFSLFGAMHEFEAKLIEQALEEAGGSVTKAARLLGLPHQTLSTMLSTPGLSSRAWVVSSACARRLSPALDTLRETGELRPRCRRSKGRGAS